MKNNNCGLFIYSGSDAYLNDCIFWSSSTGDLNYRGERFMEESELPIPLRSAYDNLFDADTGSFCHLAEFHGEYGIVLVNQFDEDFRSATGIAKSLYWNKIQKKARELYGRFPNCSIISVHHKNSDPEGEIVVFLPWDTEKDFFYEVAQWLYDNVYLLEKLTDEDIIRMNQQYAEDSVIHKAKRKMDIYGTIRQIMNQNDTKSDISILELYQNGSDLVKSVVDAVLLDFCGKNMKAILTELDT